MTSSTTQRRGPGAPAPLAHGRAAVRALRLAMPAPPGFAGRVLAAVGSSDRYVELESPVGPVFVAFTRDGVRAIERARDPADFEADYGRRFGRRAVRVERSAAPRRVLSALERRLRGERVEVPFDLSGLTAFERDVLLTALRIPHGEVRPYGWIAREIGRPRAVRAVGSALARNPIPLAIPCHRVVRSDGRLGEYTMGGPEWKRRALRAEGLDPEELERLAAAGIRYVGSDTTRVFCLPSCHRARRISPAHRVPFRSDAESLAAGYRPCRLCRPVAEAA